MSVHGHWADNIARGIVRQADAGKGKGERVVCAAGISPSGTVHIGNFREIITVELVVRALRDSGRDVRFLYFWDDYDALRKIPVVEGVGSESEFWAGQLRRPLADIPDPLGKEESFARRNESEVEGLLPKLGIRAEYIYQSQEYRRGEYRERVGQALAVRSDIRAILNDHRARDKGLPLEWWPVTVYSACCGRDTTEIIGWDGKGTIQYRCEECGAEAGADISSGAVKLKWRVDWPMRWAHWRVDFEPAGKDHHSEGGSFTTAQHIARDIFERAAPVSQQYDFVRIKHGSGKISSSAGDVVSIGDVLRVYQPEVVRYLFAGTRPNAEFAISFDVDVVKIYEDYDRCEAIACTPPGGEGSGVSEKRRGKEQRIYELSQVRPGAFAQHSTAASGESGAPVQISFRHLCTLVQIHQGDGKKALEGTSEYGAMDADRQHAYLRRAACAYYWVQNYAPESFRFTLADPAAAGGQEGARAVEVDSAGLAALRILYGVLDGPAGSDGHELHNALYQIAEETKMVFRDLCALLYQILIRRDDGPRLANFMVLLGIERCRDYLRPYVGGGDGAEK